MVLVRYWAAARAAAGCTEESIEAATIGQLVTTLSTRPDLARVLRSSSLLIDGVATPISDTERPLEGAGEVHVLPPFAGG
ncbi:MAG TPA: MoaD/ThiS family protein [Mycobacteriales bacterium]|nr:MoaD/ThiS family protein [Mycobacteriales bacterium]